MHSIHYKNDIFRQHVNRNINHLIPIDILKIYKPPRNPINECSIIKKVADKQGQMICPKSSRIFVWAKQQGTLSYFPRNESLNFHKYSLRSWETMSVINSGQRDQFIIKFAISSTDSSLHHDLSDWRMTTDDFRHFQAWVAENLPADGQRGFTNEKPPSPQHSHTTQLNRCLLFALLALTVYHCHSFCSLSAKLSLHVCDDNQINEPWRKLVNLLLISHLMHRHLVGHNVRFSSHRYLPWQICV